MLARYRQAHGVAAELPPGGYEGAYVNDLAQAMTAEYGDALLSLSDEAASAKIGPRVEALVLRSIERDLADMGVAFDRWYSERSLYEEGLLETPLAILRQGGHIFERDGAVWFASSELGEDRDNVVSRSNGQPTYFASDIAYFYEKFVHRGFDRVIADVCEDEFDRHEAIPRRRPVRPAVLELVLDLADDPSTPDRQRDLGRCGGEVSEVHGERPSDRSALEARRPVRRQLGGAAGLLSALHGLLLGGIVVVSARRDEGQHAG